MNFLDTYDVPGTPPRGQSEQSLNEEVNQVIGQLGGFWRGFRQQSQSALGSVVTQAQKELSKLTTETPVASTGTLDELPVEERGDVAGEASHTRTPSQTFLSRLQSALPPNIVETVQNNLPATNLRTTLTTEFQRVQDVTRAQAEEYVHKSEALFREAGQVLREAVKVVPPEEQDAGLIWDGSDVWMLPSATSNLSSSQQTVGARKSGESQRVVATRAESLLKRLKQNPEIIKHDPEADQAVKDVYDQWVASVEGGVVDFLQNPIWSAKIESALADATDGDALKSTRDTLVPSELTPSVFWLRYFFRVYQIERDEEKRKALLQGSTDAEEDFNWDDEETSPTVEQPTYTQTETPRASTTTSSPTEKLATPAQSTHTSPRASDDGSYDLVSSQASIAGDVPEVEPHEEKKESTKSDGEDSDWE